VKKDFWEARYKEAQYAYGTEPNEFFKLFLDGCQPGKLLLPAEGEGRNAVYAARRGWDVNAFDFSLNARKKAMELAVSTGVSINYFVADIEFYELSEELFDVISLIHIHFPPSTRKYVHRKMINSLKKGGFLVMEAFSKNQLKFKSGGPSNVDMLYSVDDLKEDFHLLDIQTLDQVEYEMNEGPFHQGTASVVRLVAMKI
jgi:SAM-dependent methyltransferase